MFHVRAALLAGVLLVQVAVGFHVDSAMVVMRDGTRLATTIWLPDTWPLPRPVILSRTPYSRSISSSAARDYCDRRGYVYVGQNVRGTGGSEGLAQFLLTDGWGQERDGYDCIEWIAAQSWCDGQIGTKGFSAPGCTQYFASGAAPPHFTCAIPQAGNPSHYQYLHFQGGEFRKAFVESWAQGQGQAHMLDTFELHAVYDSVWWGRVDLTSRWDSVQVPMLHNTGWFDLFTDGQIEAHCELNRRLGNQKLVVGPWTHHTWNRREVGDLVFPPSARFSPLYSWFNRWHDYWLRGDSNGIMQEPAVSFYLMGDCDTQDTNLFNHWVFSDTWPLPEVEYASFFLHSDGTLDTFAPGGFEVPDTFVYDPDDPCPTIGGREFTGVPGGYGPKDQALQVESRGDVLVYTTGVLLEPVAVVGKVLLRLFASSNRYDTDWAIRLCDVYPDGRSILMTDNILKARHRYGWDREDSLVPNQPDTFDIDVWSTANVFNTGHRIRVSITSSNSPRFEKNPNNGGPFRRNDPNKLVATNVVHFSPAMPTRLELPIYPLGGVGVENGELRITNGELRMRAFGPGPAIRVELASARSCPCRLELIDAAGRVVEEREVRLLPGTCRFTLGRDVPRGAYLVRAGNDDWSAVVKTVRIE